jgi:WD40 repeat protein
VPDSGPLTPFGEPLKIVVPGADDATPQRSGGFSLSFLGDEAKLAVCAADGKILTWNAADTGKTTNNPMATRAQTWWVQALATYEDMWAAACEDGKVRVWTATSEPPLELNFVEDFATSVALSVTGEYLAAGSDDGKIGVWQRKQDGQFEPPKMIPAHQAAVRALAFTQGGQRATLASASLDGTIRFWDPETGDYRGNLQGHTSAVEALAFRGDELLLSADRRSVKRWKSPKSSDQDTLPAAVLDVERTVD